MHIEPFALERSFAAYEFKAEALLSASDCESVPLAELLALADHETRRMWDALRLGYTESQGNPALREEVARLYATIAPDNVLVAAPEEAIFLAMHAILRPGDHVIAVHPAYQSLYALAEYLGCHVTRWPLEPSGSGWQLNMGFLEEHLTDNTKLIVLNFPHNPTGHILTRAELDHIIAKAQARGVHVFSDEMYRLLERDAVHRLPAVCDLYDRGVTLSGLSKAYGLPGLRIGWLATRDSMLLEQCITWHDYTTICNSAPSELLALVALRAGPTILTRNRELLRDNLRIAEAYFAQRRAFFDWLPPLGGSVAFPRWLHADTSVGDFCRGALESQGLMVVAGEAFAFPGEHFRVGLGRADFATALGRLEAYLETLDSASHCGQRNGSVSS